MPRDLSQSETRYYPVDAIDPEVEKFRAEIVEAMGTEEARDRLAEVFKWQIARGEGHEQVYRLRASQGQAPGDKWHYLGNIVLQGGGTLGLAHAGLLAALEEAHIRFAGVAGTSAGSIIAMGLIAIRKDDLTSKTATEIEALVRNVPMDTFIDGPRPVRMAIKHFLLGRRLYAPGQWSNVLFCVRRMLRLHGLNPGTAFEDWMQETLEKYDLLDMDGLMTRLKTQAVALLQATTTGENPFIKALPPDTDGSELLRIVSTAMPIGSKFSFPEFIRYLDTEGQSLSPAAIVRMSMSIPVFFEPRSMPVNKSLSVEESEWAKFVAKHIEPFSSEQEIENALDVDKLYFLDGGIFSNLPVSELPQADGVPTVTIPLISNRFVTDRKRPGGLDAIIGHVLTLVHAVRRLHDREGVQRTQPRMLKVDTDEANWLNFLMSDEEKTALYRAGFKRGRDMIVEGKWDELGK